MLSVLIRILNEVILISIHSIHFHDKIKKISIKYPVCLFSYAIRRISQELKNQFEQANGVESLRYTDFVKALSFRTH